MARCFTVYGRYGCHLCDDMLQSLQELQQAHGFSVRFVDIEGDTALEERYGVKIPVLMDEDREICHYVLDWKRLQAFLDDQ